MVSARIAEMVLRDEKAVVPIGSYHKEYGATFSLPSVVGRGAVIDVMEPDMSDDERQALQRSVKASEFACSHDGAMRRPGGTWNELEAVPQWLRDPIGSARL